MRWFLFVLLISFWPAHAVGMDMGEDPWLWSLRLDELEWAPAKDESLSWDVQGWTGRDLNKLWIKSEGKWEEGGTEKAEFQALYSHAVSAYWNLQTGWRRETHPGPDQDWLAIGYHGLAPYFFEVDASLFLAASGRAAVRLEAEYELLLTQRLIITPEVELNAHSQDDPERGIGSGLSNVKAGLRLRYEIRREFAPYLGVVWERSFGHTADFRDLNGKDQSEWRAVIGLKAWF